MAVFSMIIPVYRTEQYLSRCIYSVLNQTFQDYEIILVDDGSPDNCPSICDEFAEIDSRVKVIHKINGGVSSARNVGIEEANGDYIWFVDSDDYIEEFALEQIYDAIQEKYADLYLFNTNSIKESFTGGFEEFLYRYYFTYIVGFGPWNKIYRRKLLIENDLRFDTEETVGEDLLFNLNYYNLLFRGGKKESSFFS